MAKKGLIVITDEKSGRMVAVRLASLRRLEYEFEQLIDRFELGASEEQVPLVPISQTFAIRLKRMASDPRIQMDQNVTLSISSSPRPLP